MKGPKNGPGWLLGIIAVGWMAVVLTFEPAPTRPPRNEVLEPAPSLEWTTDAGNVIPFIGRALLQEIPKEPFPTQRRAGQCDDAASQEEINGGCWVQTKKKPPCPMGIQWEHDGKCWLPALRAAPTPTSGGGGAPGVAAPSE